MERRPPSFTRTDTLLPYTTLCRAEDGCGPAGLVGRTAPPGDHCACHRLWLEYCRPPAVVDPGWPDKSRLASFRHPVGLDGRCGVRPVLCDLRPAPCMAGRPLEPGERDSHRLKRMERLHRGLRRGADRRATVPVSVGCGRSEEHTSELQSLM